MLKGNKSVLRSAKELLELLWYEDIFNSPRKFNEVSQILSKRGNNFSKPELGLALRRATFLLRRGTRGAYEYIQKTPAPIREIKVTKSEILPNILVKKLNKEFATEISDLHLNFGRSGTCSAFLLRKILEKLIFLTFAKNGLDGKLKEANGHFIGLESMISLASQEKVGGLYFLMPKTAESIKGIKFLGDTSAHNPLTNVDMKTINLQMPFIITAYEELSKKL